MQTRIGWRIGSLVAGFILVASSLQAQGRLVVSHDEWLTSNGIFTNPSYDNQTFIHNTLNWFGLTSSDKVLVYTDNTYLYSSDLMTYLTTTLGLNVTHNASEAAGNFSNYKAILVGGNSGMDAAALAAYVLNGGHVFYEGGTGLGGAAGEAAYSNPFLNLLGLSFAPVYNGLGAGGIGTSTFVGQGPFGPALFTGVGSVYANNGNDVSLTALPVANVVDQVWYSGDHGVFGAAEVGVVPEPATLLLLGTGLIGVVGAARRRKRRDA